MTQNPNRLMEKLSQHDSQEALRRNIKLVQVGTYKDFFHRIVIVKITYTTKLDTP